MEKVEDYIRFVENLKQEIESQKKYIKVRKSIFTYAILVGTVALVAIVAVSTIIKSVSALNCLSISLITVSLFSLVKDYVRDIPKELNELNQLEHKLKSMERRKC